MMIVYRLCKTQHQDDLSGKGAEKTGGRWNSRGRSVLYTCESRALCTTEIAVHMPLGVIPDDYLLLSIEIPDNVSILELQEKGLPENWKSFPHPDTTQKIGDKILNENKFLIIKVPSVVVQGDFNYLINPQHKDFNKIKVLITESFEFDTRLFKK